MRRSILPALVASGLLLCSGCGGSKATPAAASPQAVRTALVARLHAKLLSFRWVACVRDRRSYHGQRIVRCNVNFGQPHIVRYCAVLEDGRLITNRENRALRCER
jgi:hypothetical protein